MPRFQQDPDGKSAAPGTYARVLRLARTQHGVVSRRQVLALGVGRGWIEHALRTERLHRIFRGVYAVGRPELGPRGRWMAAVLAYGPRAVLSHQSAAALHGMRNTARAVIDLSLARAGSRRRKGVQVHDLRDLHPQDIVVVDGIPCTSPERTLLDLADALGRQALDKACARAYELRILEPLRLHRQLYAPGRRTRKLRAALRVPPGRHRSQAEKDFETLLLEHGVPQPLVNVWFPNQMVEADFYWPGYGLVFELDTGDHHRTPHGIEHDAMKDARLTAIGLRVLRSQHGDLAALRAILRALGAAVIA